MKIDCIGLCSSFSGAYPDKKEIKDMLKKEFGVSGRKLLPSLVDLCIKTAIDNVRYLGDVGETDINLLDRILPHCTLDQLMHVEKCSEVRRPVFLRN